MSEITEILKLAIVTAFLIVGAFLMLTAAIGLVRFPDVYSRMHATGKCDTLGVSLMLMGLVIFQGPDLVSVKLLFIIFFVLFTGPVAVHALFRAAIIRGYKMWTREGWKLWRKEGHE